MKRYDYLAALLFATLLLTSSASAQLTPRGANIVAAEYFVGTDPGVGNGTPITVTTPGQSVDLQVSNLSLPLNQIVFVRCKDANNKWSAATPYRFRGYGNNRSIDITRAEYFIGSDPGPGNGTAISVTPGPNPTFEALNITLSTGQRIWTRARDADGRWSSPVPYTFRGYGNNRSVDITRAEYFIGSDPGPGNGTAITITPGQDPTFEAPNIALSRGQRISTRVRDADGRWSGPVAKDYPNEIVIRAELSTPQPAPPGTGIPMIASDGNFDSAVEAIEGTLSNWNRIDSIWVRVQSSSYYWSFPIGDRALYYPAVTLTSISPTIGARLQSLPVLMNGSNFIAGVTTVNFGPNITIDSVVVLSASQLRAYITISATAATGTRDVSVSNPSPGGGTATLSNAFTVNNPAPIVTSISPTSGNRLQTLYDTLNGSNFISGVTVVNYGPGINVISTTVSSPTRIVANISISASAATGARRVYVTNSPPGGGTDSSRTFTVNNPAPSLIAISPDSGIRGQSLIVTFTGTGYIDGVSSVNVGPGITVDSLTVLDPTRIRAYISISFGATPGNRNFSVTNTPPGGGTSENRVFRVNNPGPTLTGITPAMGNRLDTLAVTFIGTNFFSGITSVNVGQGIIVRSTIVVSPETLTANITITDTAATGPRNFSVTNASPGGGTSGSQTFTINNPVPVLDSINPTDASRGQTLNLTLRGRKFIRGASFVNITPTGIAIDSTSVNSGTQMTARITVTSSATVGTYSVSVINQPPGGGASGSVTFNVINNAPTAPRLMAPAHGDTLQLMDPAVPVSFTWRRSLDPDPLDTLSYTLTLWGANLDTLFSGLTDTSVSLDIMERLQVATDYWWTIRVTDHIVTVTSPDTFLFRTSNTITAADLLPEIPKEYRVFQNYPNPFNTSTTIRYELPKESRVLLKVFNILGQEVATLVDEVKRPGRYSVQWNAGNVASGMYLYRLRAGEFVKTKKLVLLK